MNIPRYVKCEEIIPSDKSKPIIRNFTLGKEITCLIDITDKLMLESIIVGSIISSDVYPLIYDLCNKSLRSMEYYEKVINEPNLYKEMKDKIYFHIGIRDLYMASIKNLLNEKELKLMKDVISLIDDEDDINLNGLNISPYPTKNKFIVQFVDLNIDSYIKEYFIRNELNLYMVFVDIRDLSYHNFENIIGLDEYFTNYMKNNREQWTLLKFNYRDEIYKDRISIYKLTNGGYALRELDELNLYIEPLNSSSRGGKRFIFKSDILAKELEAAIPKKYKNKLFVRINNVFRYNKFYSNDKRFVSHRDTSYYDKSKGICSKYTLIIYLTEGMNDDYVLKIGDVKISKIEQDTCVIFDQEYEHEGMAFVNNEKIFIRTELLYYVDTLKHMDYNPYVSKVFNIACYMTKESMYHKELSQYSNDMFNYVAKMRNNLKTNEKELILLHKCYEDIHFITNGNDYYFSKKYDLKRIAQIILLDYFNAKINGKYDIKSEIISNINIYDMLDRLYNSSKDESSKLCIDSKKLQLKDITDEHHLPHGQCPDDRFQGYDEDGRLFETFSYYDREFTCEEEYENPHDYTIHHYFNPEKCEPIIKTHNNICKHYNNTLDQYSVSIFNNSININSKDIKVLYDKIIFDHSGYHSAINFASCQCEYEAVYSDQHYLEYINIEKKEIKGFKVPPIYYIVEGYPSKYPLGYIEGYHLTIDMFNNDLIFNEDISLYKPTIDDMKTNGNDYYEEIREFV